MRKFKTLILLFALLAALVAFTGCAGSKSGAGNQQAAQAWEGSNLSTPYPDNNCNQPLKPDPGDGGGLYMIYQQQLDAYTKCINDYVKNAKHDIMIIENKANFAMREYRGFVTLP